MSQNLVTGWFYKLRRSHESSSFSRHVTKAWSKRYFVIVKDKVKWYKNADPYSGESPNGSVNFQQILKIRVLNSESRLEDIFNRDEYGTYSIEIDSRARRLVIRTASKELAKQFVSELRRRMEIWTDRTGVETLREIAKPVRSVDTRDHILQRLDQAIEVLESSRRDKPEKEEKQEQKQEDEQRPRIPEKSAKVQQQLSKKKKKKSRSKGEQKETEENPDEKKSKRSTKVSSALEAASPKNQTLERARKKSKDRPKSGSSTTSSKSSSSSTKRKKSSKRISKSADVEFEEESKVSEEETTKRKSSRSKSSNNNGGKLKEKTIEEPQVIGNLEALDTFEDDLDDDGDESLRETLGLARTNSKQRQVKQSPTRKAAKGVEKPMFQRGASGSRSIPAGPVPDADWLEEDWD